MNELTNVRSFGDKGALKFVTTRGEDIFVIGATTGIPFGPTNQYTVNITAAATLVPSTHAGAIVYCTTDNVVVTLPAVAASTQGLMFTIMNTASDGAALLELKTGGAGDYVVIGGTVTATTNLVIANTKATQQYGDSLTVIQGAWVAGGTTNCWITTNYTGTWVAQAAT